MNEELFKKKRKRLKTLSELSKRIISILEGGIIPSVPTGMSPEEPLSSRTINQANAVHPIIMSSSSDPILNLDADDSGLDKDESLGDIDNPDVVIENNLLQKYARTLSGYTGNIKESQMINEEFGLNGGDSYNPGDSRMQSPEGNGVVDKKLSKMKVGKYDSNMKNMGKAWPRKHNDTPAMCDVDEDGVEHEPQGTHVSKHGDPDDGHTTEVGHDWPDKPKNFGGSTERFEGDRWSDGGVLGGNSKVEENWDNLEAIGRTLGEDIDLQRLFDKYANSVGAVCLEDFETILRANGSDILLDESYLLSLMGNNKTRMFYEGEDANGRYWSSVPLNEAFGDDDVDGMQVKSPSSEVAGPSVGSMDEGDFDDFDGGYDDGEHGQFGDDDFLNDDEYVPNDNPSQLADNTDGLYDTIDDGIDGIGGIGDSMDDDMGGMDDDMNGVGGGPDDDMLDDDSGLSDDDEIGGLVSPTEHETIHHPQMESAIRKFMNAAGNILENRSRYPKKTIVNALNESWKHHAKHVNPRKCPSSVKHALSSLMKSYPGFNPISENAAVDSPEGTALGGKKKLKKSKWLPEQEQIDQPDRANSKNNFLGRKLENDVDSEPVMKGTGKESTQQVQENVNKLEAYVRKSIAECCKSLPKNSKYDMSFKVAVRENNQYNLTNSRRQLSEALLDAEEILQYHNPNRVLMVVRFTNGNKLVKEEAIPLIGVAKRKPIVAEGKILFRFSRNAESLAAKLVSEGKACKVNSHNWGCAVSRL